MRSIFRNRVEREYPYRRERIYSDRWDHDDWDDRNTRTIDPDDDVRRACDIAFSAKSYSIFKAIIHTNVLLNLPNTTTTHKLLKKPLRPTRSSEAFSVLQFRCDHSEHIKNTLTVL